MVWHNLDACRYPIRGIPKGRGEGGIDDMDVFFILDFETTSQF